MARTHEETAYYIRTRDGDTFYVDTLTEALEEFVGNNGYRLTLAAGGNEVVVRRSKEIVIDDNDYEKEWNASVIHRNKL